MTARVARQGGAFGLALLLIGVAVQSSAGTLPLIAKPPTIVPRAPGFFDYMIVDQSAHRLIVSHTGSDSVAFVDSQTGAFERQLYIGAAHGIAIDERGGKYYVGVSGARKGIAVIDRKKLVITGHIETPGPVDALAFDSRRGNLFADADNGESIWVVSAARGKVVATIRTPQDSDKEEYDPRSDRVYQNFTTTNTLMVIDPSTLNKRARFSTLPATKPHGLAVDSAHRRVFAAGTNGWLVALDVKTGRVAKTTHIARHVDQIALDRQRHRIYCASGDGVLTVLDEQDGDVRWLADIKVPNGAHTVAVDEGTGAVWISYGTQTSDYVERLVPLTTRTRTPHRQIPSGHADLGL